MVSASAKGIVGTLIGIFVAFILYAELVPEVQTAGELSPVRMVTYG